MARDKETHENFRLQTMFDRAAAAVLVAVISVVCFWGLEECGLGGGVV